MSLEDLVLKENWQLGRRKSTGQRLVIVDGEHVFPLVHPFHIHAKFYRESTIPEIKYRHFKAMHDYLWPDTVWHDWTEERFRVHCEPWKFISYAGCADSAKSYDAAKIGFLFYASDFTRNAVLVASTTLDSLDKRIWGYVLRLMSESKLKFPLIYQKAKPGKIIHKHTDDRIHGMFAVAAGAGTDEASIKNWIGIHPTRGLMVVLDECTDLPIAINSAVANLRTAPYFQLKAIGNSTSRYDLHGVLSTPEDGWDSVDPYDHTRWKTKREGGICLYFNAYRSPAISETHTARKKILSTFLPTNKKIQEAERDYGTDNPVFWRFYLGFWPSKGESKTLISENFLDEQKTRESYLWGPEVNPLPIAALDPAFTADGDECVLRVGYVCQTRDGIDVLDLGGENMIFRCPIREKVSMTEESQIAQWAIQILSSFRIPLSRLAVDATGQGRAIAEVIRLTMRTEEQAIRIYVVGGRGSQGKVDKTLDAYLASGFIKKTAFDLWSEFRTYVSTQQIRGIDAQAAQQIGARMIEWNDKLRSMALESKKDYISRMRAIHGASAKSPGEADTVMLLMQAATLAGGMRISARRPRLGDGTGLFTQQGQLVIGVDPTAKAVQRPVPKAQFLTDSVRKSFIR